MEKGLERIMGNMIAGAERKSWERQEVISFDVYKELRSKSGRSYVLNLSKVQRGDRHPSGISEDDAKSIGHRVFRVTTIRERIK